MLTAIAIFGFLSVLILISLCVRKANTVDEYLIGGRQSGTIQVGSGLFTLIGGGEFVTLASLGFLFGWSAIALFIGYCLGFILLACLANRIRAQASEKLYVSLPDYMHDRFGRIAGTLVFLVSFAAFFALLMLQFSAVGAVIAPLIGLPRSAVIAITGAVIVCYLLIGGFRAVMATDVVQAFAMLALVPLLLFLVASQQNVTIPFATGTEGTLPLSLWFSLVIVGLLIAAASADVWQRAYAAKSTNAARAGFFLGAISFLFIGLAGVGFGTLASTVGLENPDTAFVDILSGYLPENLDFVVAVLVLAALMSTADTEIFLLTALLQKETTRIDFMKNIFVDGKGLFRLRILLILVATSSLIAAYLASDLVGVYTWILSALITVSPAVVGSLLIPTNKTAIVASIITGLAVFFGGAHFGYVTLDNLHFVAIPAAFVFIAFSLRSNQAREV